MILIQCYYLVSRKTLKQEEIKRRVTKKVCLLYNHYFFMSVCACVCVRERERERESERKRRKEKKKQTETVPDNCCRNHLVQRRFLF